MPWTLFQKFKGASLEDNTIIALIISHCNFVRVEVVKAIASPRAFNKQCFSLIENRGIIFTHPPVWPQKKESFLPSAMDERSETTNAKSILRVFIFPYSVCGKPLAKKKNHLGVFEVEVEVLPVTSVTFASTKNHVLFRICLLPNYNFPFYLTLLAKVYIVVWVASLYQRRLRVGVFLFWKK